MLQAKIFCLFLRGDLIILFIGSVLLRHVRSHVNWFVTAILLLMARKVNIPSIQLKVGDVIELREKSRKIVSINDSLEAVVRRGIPQWLELDRDAFKGSLKVFRFVRI